MESILEMGSILAVAGYRDVIRNQYKLIVNRIEFLFFYEAIIILKPLNLKSKTRNIFMVKYEIIINWSKEGEAYVAEVPEFSGCKADGETYIEAFKNAEVIISEWIETAKELGREILQPKGKLIFV